MKWRFPGKAFLVFATVMLFTSAGLSFTGAAAGNNDVQTIVNNGQFIVNWTAPFSAGDFIFGTNNGFDTVILPDGQMLTTPGAPMLPTAIVRIALPAGMKVTEVEVTGVDREELSGSFDIFPAQPPLPINISASEADFIGPDESLYGSDEAYPGFTARLISQADLAGQSFAIIEIAPLSYIPAAGKLILNRNIDIRITGTEGYVCGDYLSPNASQHEIDFYRGMLNEMVINPSDVVLNQKTIKPLSTTGVGPGDYEYVIITPSSWEDDFQSLADWKTKKGVPATIVTTEWIYNSGGYSGSNSAKIRSFVIDAVNNWGTLYFLLGGDTDWVPKANKYLVGEYVPGDTYYSDYDDDWVVETNVGRAAVRNTSQISTFINKIMTYEKNPSRTDYAKTAVLLGFDLYTYGSGEGENCKEYIDNNFIPGSWTVRTEYDSEYGRHKTDSINYLNLGNNLANHIDHSGGDVLGVGYTNHGDLLDNYDIDNLHNGSKQTIFYSIGCWPCSYDYTTCIAEHFVQNSNGGGIAFIGNSRYGWYSPYNSDYYSLRYDRYFFRSLFDQNHYILGECLSDHKNDSISGDETYRYIFYELTLLGDPELPVLTENPSNLTVTHDGTLTAGEYNDFPVTVTSGGYPVQDARVCLWKDGDVYQVMNTNSSGIADFSVMPLTEGTMFVTATKHNYIPAESSALVQGGGNPLVFDSVDPGTPGTDNTFTVTGATPGETIYYIYGFTQGSDTEIPGCSGVYAGILSPKRFGEAVANGSGVATLTVFVPDGAAGRTVLFQGIEQSTCRVSTILSITF